MATITVTINTRTKRAKHLLAIIEEFSKIDNGIEIEKFETEFKQSLHEVNTGNVKLIKQRNV